MNIVIDNIIASDIDEIELLEDEYYWYDYEPYDFDFEPICDVCGNSKCYEPYLCEDSAIRTYERLQKLDKIFNSDKRNTIENLFPNIF